jgi:hypothetical protein
LVSLIRSGLRRDLKNFDKSPIHQRIFAGLKDDPAGLLKRFFVAQPACKPPGQIFGSAGKQRTNRCAFHLN